MFEGGAVIRFAFFVRAVLEREKIVVSQIFHQGDLSADIVVENFWDVQSGCGEEVSDREEVGVVRALEGVMHADEARMAVSGDADDGATGRTLLDRLHENLVGRVEIEVSADGCEESVGWHREV